VYLARVGFFFKPETGEVISADAYCDPVPECLGRFGCTAIFVGDRH
jgi:hypothetical protein